MHSYFYLYAYSYVYDYFSFQVNNIKSLCKTMVETTRSYSPPLVDEAVVIKKKYETL